MSLAAMEAGKESVGLPTFYLGRYVGEGGWD